MSLQRSMKGTQPSQGTTGDLTPATLLGVVAKVIFHWSHASQKPKENLRSSKFRLQKGNASFLTPQ